MVKRVHRGGGRREEGGERREEGCLGRCLGSNGITAGVLWLAR